MNRREFSRRYCATISISFVSLHLRQRLYHRARARERERATCPVKTDSQNLLISRVPPGENGKRGDDGSGEICELAHQKTPGACGREVSQGRSCYCFRNVSRALHQLRGGPRTEGRGDIARSYLGYLLPSALRKDRSLIPESFVRSSRSTYRSTIF